MSMSTICIISSSIRTDRRSHRVALFLQNYLKNNNLADSKLLDLKEFAFPLFEERLRYLKEPSPHIKEFAASISEADGIIIVCPEYNGGIPASLKNVIDLLYDEWYRKPVAISTVSSGAFGGSQVIIALQFLLWKIKAWTVPALFPVPNVNNSFDENGLPMDPDTSNKRAAIFINELFWCMEANRKMKS